MRAAEITLSEDERAARQGWVRATTTRIGFDGYRSTKTGAASNTAISGSTKLGKLGSAFLDFDCRTRARQHIARV